jgi:hypothetical protein
MLRKFDHQYIAMIPNYRNKAGELAPDAAMADVVRSLHPGDAVRAGFEVGPGSLMLRYLLPYRPPVEATFQKLHHVDDAGHAHVDLDLLLARRPMTCRLRQDSSACPSLGFEELAGLPAGMPLKVVMDLQADPPGVQLARPDGGVVRRGDQIAARGGHVIFVARQQDDWHGTLNLASAPDGPGNVLRAGLEHLMADPARKQELPASTIATLRSAAKPISFPAVESLSELVKQWAAAEDEISRQKFAWQIELQLSRLSVDATAHEAYLFDRVRAMLTPSQYRRVMELGRPAQRPATADAIKAATQPD